MDVQTLVTGLRRVRRRHQNQRNSCESCFVFQELTELVERPSVDSVSLGFAAQLLIDPFPDPCQVFQSNSTVGSFCPGDNSFRDAMIDPRLKASLLARQPLQQLTASAPRTAGALTGFALSAALSLE